jgi:hypothetical protein
VGGLCVGNFVNYIMRFIACTNRHQTCFDTLKAPVAAEYPVGLVDSFLAALNAKKLTPPAKRFTNGPCKKAHQCRWRLLLTAIFAVVKYGVL